MRLRAWCGAALLAVTAALFAGCGGSSVGDGTIAHAAKVTAREGTAQVKLHMAGEAEGTTFSMDGDGVISTRTDSDDGRMAITFAADGKDGSMDVVSRDGIAYMRSDLFKGQLPFNRTWLKVDLAKLGGQGEGGLDFGVTNATQMLDFLRGAGGVEKVGSEEVAGTTTTHYRADTEADKLIDTAASEQDKADAREVLGDATSIPFDAWVDGSDRIRRFRMKLPIGDTGGSLDMSMDFIRFGAVMNLDVPDDDDVFDATGLAEQAKEKGTG